jgi:hypothetical protein
MGDKKMGDKRLKAADFYLSSSIFYLSSLISFTHKNGLPSSSTSRFDINICCFQNILHVAI